MLPKKAILAPSKLLLLPIPNTHLPLWVLYNGCKTPCIHHTTIPPTDSSQHTQQRQSAISAMQKATYYPNHPLPFHFCLPTTNTLLISYSP